MPITSIWPIKGSYVQALSYIANPMKTEAKDGIVAELEDVLDYVSNGEKTNQKFYVRLPLTSLMVSSPSTPSSHSNPEKSMPPLLIRSAQNWPPECGETALKW